MTRNIFTRRGQATRAIFDTIGALALGALAVGALAIGALAVGRLMIGRAQIRRLEIDELVVGKLRVTKEWSTPPRRMASKRSGEARRV
jgi:hypothetical protein